MDLSPKLRRILALTRPEARLLIAGTAPPDISLTSPMTQLRARRSDLRDAGRASIMRAAAMTDVGLRRENNEDAFVTLPEAGLIVVADGVGGHAAGEDASLLATEVFTRQAERLHELGEAYSSSPNRRNGVRILHTLELLTHQANSEVCAMALERGHVGTSTTLVAYLVAGDAAFVVHVGASRAYLARHGVLFPLTRDHSVVGEMVRLGLLTSEQARRHPKRNLITQAVGGLTDCVPDTRVVQLHPGDRLLLATDGLTDMVDDRTIEVLAGLDELDEAAEALLQAALAAGGRDNVTLALVAPEVPRPALGSQRGPPPDPSHGGPASRREAA